MSWRCHHFFLIDNIPEPAHVGNGTRLTPDVIPQWCDEISKSATAEVGGTEEADLLIQETSPWEVEHQ